MQTNNHRIIHRISLLFFAAIIAMSVITGTTPRANAVANVPACDFSKGDSALNDFKAGRCVCDYSFYGTNGVTWYSPCPEECAPDQLRAITLSGVDNREKIFNFFIQQGLTTQQASGIVGNIKTESGGTYSPTINEFSEDFPGGGYGIVQWTGGRRTNLVNYMTQRHPDLMEKYYTAAYSTKTDSKTSYTGESAGYIPKNAFTGEVMLDTHNDALLLAELEFLMLETTGRTIRPLTTEKVPGLSVGENEWEAVKKQKDIKGASDVWVYNFEIPANIDTTAQARVANGQSIYDLYKDVTSDPNNCDDGLVGPTRQKVVQVAEEEYVKWESGEMKAGTDFRKYLESNGDTEWCAYFVSWVYKQAGYTVTADGTPYLRVSQLENATDRFDIHPADGSYTPQPGDIVSYGYHTNLVVAVSPDNPRDYTTIGGNEGGSAGDGMWKTSFVKKTSGTYWAAEAEYYISPKG